MSSADKKDLTYTALVFILRTSKQGGIMEFISLQDRTTQNISRLVDALHLDNESSGRCSNIFAKAPNLHLLYEDNIFSGFIIFKYDAAKKVVFCPYYISPQHPCFAPDAALSLSRQIFADAEIQYASFLSIFDKSSNRQLLLQKSPWDYCISMQIQNATQNTITMPEIQCQRENLSFEQLLELHLAAYNCEPPYVVSGWDELLVYFLSKPQPVIVTCRRQNQIIGACLGFVAETGHYIYSVCLLPEFRRKGYGYQMLQTYLSLTKENTYLLDVQNSNIPARKLYEQMGFKPLAVNGVVYKM
jgi:ribosomal protein S18 acetylase RimI-like enzyme